VNGCVRPWYTGRMKKRVYIETSVISTHLDNAERKPDVRRVCSESGFRCPEICTPQELMGDEDVD